MAMKRHKPEEIVLKLRQVDVLVGQGMSRPDAIRQVSITEQTYYRWRKQYGGMGTNQLKQLKQLQKENEQLRKAVADLTIDKQILQDLHRSDEFGLLHSFPFRFRVLIRGPLFASTASSFSRLAWSDISSSRACLSSLKIRAS